MKMKVAGIVCVLLLIGAWALVHAQTVTPSASSALPSGSNGRYQVIPADIDFTDMGGKLKHKTAIRIDTQTGQTWELTEVGDLKNGGISFVWVKSNEMK
jgi:hypothetical protein